MRVIYYHINNGGVSIGVDRCSLVIESGHFGNNIHAMRLDTTVEGIRMLGQMLLDHAATNPETRYAEVAEPRIVEREKMTNISTFDDYDYSRDGAAEKDSKFNMSQTKAHPAHSGIIVYNRTTGTYWWVLDNEIEGTSDEAVPSGARWTGMRDSEIADKILNIETST